MKPAIDIVNIFKTLLGTALLLCACSTFAADLAKVSAAPRVEMKTSEGAITIELYPDKAPVSAANFLQYVREGFYDGLIFHRVIDGFMIQGGAHKPDMSMKTPRAPIGNEAKNGLRNEAGTLAMARTGDPDSAASQFFINLVDNRALDYPSPDGHGYAVFGRVVSGFDVVQKIGKTRTGYGDVPRTAVVIQSARIVPAAK